MNNNQQQVAIVTGSNGKMGIAIAARLRAMGHRIVGIDMGAHSVDRGTDAAHYVQADLRQVERIAPMVEDIVRRFGSVRVLVNNAGIWSGTSFFETTPESYATTFDVNVRAPFFLTQAVAWHIDAQSAKGGVIVNVGSMVARTPSAIIDYSASKAAITHMTRALAKPLGALGMRVVGVAPGFITTALSDRVAPDRREGVLAGSALGRAGTADEDYAVYAIRYASRESRRCNHFVDAAPADDVPMTMDFYVWLAIGEGRVVLVDTGYGEEVARRRDRPLLRDPVEALQLLGVQPQDVTDVVLTHLHYDHAGNADRFPHATIHVQEAEAHFASGRYMAQTLHARFIEAMDVAKVSALNFGQRVHMCQGRVTIAPGIELIAVGGHTPGMQIARVRTARGWVVLASDAMHFYENYKSGRLFPSAFDEGQANAAFDTIREAAGSDGLIVAGHDPLVMRRFPPASDALAGVVARIQRP
jgi:NAD(P)-dependent dehydrogenase (short-subunit alcohol dehydrogenase family)/glyoxylase-like metal-dependent hydrolase (beta-lactamase superfamily II)